MSDLIRREDAIKALRERWARTTSYDGIGEDIGEECEEVIEAIPSADRPQGEWVLDPNGLDWNIPAWRCSRCGFVANYIGTEANGLGRNPMNWAGSKYCPNCGCRMRKE